MATKGRSPFTRITTIKFFTELNLTPRRLERECTKDTTLNGMKIPKGLLVCSSVYAIHHDPTIWPEPHKFNPYRYNCQTGKMFSLWLLFSLENKSLLLSADLFLRNHTSEIVVVY